MDNPDGKIINLLTETITRGKASLNARMKRLRTNQNSDSERRPGRLYEVFQALND